MKQLMDIPYSREHTDRRIIDMFLPEGNGNGAAVLFIHGGGFSGGGKKAWHAVMAYLCERGYVCGSAEYRLTPQWKSPCQVHDSRIAMAWFCRNAEQYGFDANRVSTFGSSAGGYLAAILATIAPDDKWAACPELEGADTRPAAVVAYCPVISLHDKWHGKMTSIHPMLIAEPEATAPEEYRVGSVEDRVAPGIAPFLLVNGTDDKTITVAEVEMFRDRVLAVGGQAELAKLDGVPHGFGYGVSTDAQKAALGFVEPFLARTLLRKR